MIKKDVLKVPVGHNKYTVVFDSEGNLSALRYGEKWRDCIGDGLILTLAQDLDDLRNKVRLLVDTYERKNKEKHTDIDTEHNDFTEALQILTNYFGDL